MRNLEEILRDGDGNATLSRASISRVTEQTWEEYKTFMEASPDGYEPEYLWLDRVYEHLKSNEALLCAWGMTRRGEMVLPGLEPGEKAFYTAWRDLLYGLIRRGLREPVVVITYGSPALIKAVKDCFPCSFRQRCMAQKTRNVLTKVYDSIHDKTKQYLNGIYYVSSYREAKQGAMGFIKEYQHLCHRAVGCFKDVTITRIHFLVCDRRINRTMNGNERVFPGQKRRTKVSGFFSEKAALKLIFGAIVWSKKNGVVCILRMSR